MNSNDMNECLGPPKATLTFSRAHPEPVRIAIRVSGWDTTIAR
jgi:hypothetical protein